MIDVTAFRWFMVTVPSMHERNAQRILERQRLVACLPMEMIKRRRSRYARPNASNTITVARPMLPRYLFVGMPTIEDGFGKLFRTRYIAGIVCINGRPAELSPADMLDLNEIAEGRKVAEGARALPDFEAGEIVQIVDHSMEQRPLRIRSIIDDRAELELIDKVLGCEVTFTADIDRLRKSA